MNSPIETYLLCEQISTQYKEYLYGEMIDNLQLIEEFAKQYHLFKQKIPYHINVIDELHVNENANSRILASLLLYNTNGDYPLLKSFIDYCIGSWNLEIFQPYVTSEQMRIDLLVREKGKYAIIFENKIYGAVLQKNQIARYILKLRQEGYKYEQIYVVFLPPSKYEPDICSWQEPKNCCDSCDRSVCQISSAPKLKELFKDRFEIVTFREDILSWLKEEVIPNCKQKEVYLFTAAMQYLDYLEGYFDLRTINKEMNMELEHFLIEKLKLSEMSKEEKLKILDEKTEEINRLLNQMNAIKDSIRKELAIADVKKWQPYLEKIKKVLPQIGNDLQLKTKCDFLNPVNNSHFYVRLYKENWQQLSIVIEKYGIGQTDKIGDEVFIYIGIPGEERVEDKYLNKSKLFKEYRWKGSPYGWEYIERYHKNLDSLMTDINSGEFANYLKDKVKEILSKIEENKLPM